MAPSSGGGCRRCRRDKYMRRQLAAMHAALTQGCDRSFPRTAVDDMFPCKAWVCPAHVRPSPVWFRVGQHSRRRLRRLLVEPGGTAILAETSEQTRRENEEIGVLQGCSPGMPWTAVWILGCEFGIAPLKDIAGCSNCVRPPAAGGHGAKAAWETAFADHLKATEDPILRTTEGPNRDTIAMGSAGGPLALAAFHSDLGGQETAVADHLHTMEDPVRDTTEGPTRDTIVMESAGGGYPFKWAKTRGGFRVEWLGMETEYPSYKLGLSLKRATWLVEWLRGLAVSEGRS